MTSEVWTSNGCAHWLALWSRSLCCLPPPLLRTYATADPESPRRTLSAQPRRPTPTNSSWTCHRLQFWDLELQHGAFSILSSPLAWWIWIFWNLTEIRHLGRGGWRSDERRTEAAHRHRSCSGQESPDPAAGHGNVCPWQRERGYSSRSSG